MGLNGSDDIPDEYIGPAPTEEEIDQSNRFRTYLNYLSCISDFIGDVRSKPEDLIKSVVESRTFRDIQGGRCRDVEKLGQLFRNAWFTEVQMGISSHYDEFVSYSNHWTPVQLYYAVYLAERAYFRASGQEIPREHASNLRAMGEEIRRRPALFPQPWKTACVGNPEDDSARLIHLPDGMVVGRVSPLSSSARVDFWDSYGMFLRTTRQRQIDTLCADWKDTNKKKRVNSQQKKSFIENLSPTTLFHVLYRLRLRSNYSDADSFLLTVHGSDEAVRFNRALQDIGWSTLLILELLVARYIGKKPFEQIVENFRKYEKLGWSAELIGLRWDSIRGLW